MINQIFLMTLHCFLDKRAYNFSFCNLCKCNMGSHHFKIREDLSCGGYVLKFILATINIIFFVAGLAIAAFGKFTLVLALHILFRKRECVSKFGIIQSKRDHSQSF